MKVFTVICVHARETNTMQEWICSVWNVHIQIMLKVISFSILNMHELVETTGCHSQMHTFPDQMNWHFVQILMDSKFQSKFHALWWRSPKDFFVSCSGTICLVLYHSCCSFVLRHLSLLHKIQCKCLHSHHNHPRHPFITIEFIVNVKYTMDWSNRKPYTCLSFNFIVK